MDQTQCDVIHRAESSLPVGSKGTISSLMIQELHLHHAAIASSKLQTNAHLTRRHHRPHQKQRQLIASIAQATLKSCIQASDVNVKAAAHTPFSWATIRWKLCRPSANDHDQSEQQLLKLPVPTPPSSSISAKFSPQTAFRQLEHKCINTRVVDHLVTPDLGQPAVSFVHHYYDSKKCSSSKCHSQKHRVHITSAKDRSMAVTSNPSSDQLIPSPSLSYFDPDKSCHENVTSELIMPLKDQRKSKHRSSTSMKMDMMKSDYTNLQTSLYEAGAKESEQNIFSQKKIAPKVVHHIEQAILAATNPASSAKSVARSDISLGKMVDKDVGCSFGMTAFISAKSHFQQLESQPHQSPRPVDQYDAAHLNSKSRK